MTGAFKQFLNTIWITIGEQEVKADYEITVIVRLGFCGNLRNFIRKPNIIQVPIYWDKTHPAKSCDTCEIRAQNRWLSNLSYLANICKIAKIQICRCYSHNLIIHEGINLFVVNNSSTFTVFDISMSWIFSIYVWDISGFRTAKEPMIHGQNYSYWAPHLEQNLASILRVWP